MGECLAEKTKKKERKREMKSTFRESIYAAAFQERAIYTTAENKDLDKRNKSSASRSLLKDLQVETGFP